MGELSARDVRATMWWNPFTVERLRVQTSLTPHDCIQRLQEQLYPNYDVAYMLRLEPRDPFVPFYGRAHGNRFALFKNTPRFQNPFRPLATGVILPSASGGSLIRLRLSLHNIAYVFWGIVLLLYAGLFVISCLGTAGILFAASSVPNPVLVVFVGGLLIGAVVYPYYAVCAALSVSEQVFLVSTLMQVLEASDLYSDLYLGSPSGLTDSSLPTDSAVGSSVQARKEE
jgi:hypothetical protein